MEFNNGHFKLTLLFTILGSLAGVVVYAVVFVGYVMAVGIVLGFMSFIGAEANIGIAEYIMLYGSLGAVFLLVVAIVLACYSKKSKVAVIIIMAIGAYCLFLSIVAFFCYPMVGWIELAIAIFISFGGIVGILPQKKTNRDLVVECDKQD